MPEILWTLFSRHRPTCTFTHLLTTALQMWINNIKTNDKNWHEELNNFLSFVRLQVHMFKVHCTFNTGALIQCKQTTLSNVCVIAYIAV